MANMVFSLSAGFQNVNTEVFETHPDDFTRSYYNLYLIDTEIIFFVLKGTLVFHCYSFSL